MDSILMQAAKQPGSDLRIVGKNGRWAVWDSAGQEWIVYEEVSVEHPSYSGSSRPDRAIIIKTNTTNEHHVARLLLED